MFDRKSIRLAGYDYRKDGYYFVTICIRKKKCLFGAIRNGIMYLNDAGKMIQNEWCALSNRFSHVRLDAYVIMPNHIHGIIVIDHANNHANVGAPFMGAPTIVGVTRVDQGSAIKAAPTFTETLGQIIGAFKSITTNVYIRGVKQHGWFPFDRQLWQRNYYERIVRYDGSLDRIRRYISSNPSKWEQDFHYQSC